MHQQQLHDASKKQMGQELTAQKECNKVLSRAFVRMRRGVAEVKVNHSLIQVLPQCMTFLPCFFGMLYACQPASFCIAGLHADLCKQSCC